MFYDKSLMNSEMLGNAWKFANDMSTENVDESNLPKICNELDSWVGSDAVLPHRRLSLRASSNFIGGAAKLYKQGVHRLFDDIHKLDEDIIWRRKRGHFNSSESSSNDSSESMGSPDQMRRQAITGIGIETSSNNDSSELMVSPDQMRRQAITSIDSSISPKKRGKIESISVVKMTPRFTMSRSSSESVTTVSRVNSYEQDDNQCYNNNCDLDPKNVGKYSSGNSDLIPINVSQSSPKKSDCISKNNTPTKKISVSERIDKGVQTSPILISKGKPSGSSRSEDAFDRKLPFGYIMIHDSYGSRIPSKIIFTSINSDVNNLI